MEEEIARLEEELRTVSQFGDNEAAILKKNIISRINELKRAQKESTLQQQQRRVTRPVSEKESTLQQQQRRVARPVSEKVLFKKKPVPAKINVAFYSQSCRQRISIDFQMAEIPREGRLIDLKCSRSYKIFAWSLDFVTNPLVLDTDMKVVNTKSNQTVSNAHKVLAKPNLFFGEVLLAAGCSFRVKKKDAVLSDEHQAILQMADRQGENIPRNIKVVELRGETDGRGSFIYEQDALHIHFLCRPDLYDEDEPLMFTCTIPYNSNTGSGQFWHPVFTDRMKQSTTLETTNTPVDDSMFWSVERFAKSFQLNRGDYTTVRESGECSLTLDYTTTE